MQNVDTGALKQSPLLAHASAHYYPRRQVRPEKLLAPLHGGPIRFPSFSLQRARLHYPLRFRVSSVVKGALTLYNALGQLSQLTFTP